MTSRITFEGKQSELDMVSVLNEVSQSNAKRLTGSSKKGDIEWRCQKFTIVVEVKKKTYNQTRPCKYLVVVSPIYDKDGLWTGKWRVMSPPQVIKNLRNRQAKELKVKRGQHTACAMTCANLGKSSQDILGGVVVDDDGLAEAVLAAYLEGENNTLMKNFAKEELQRQEAYAAETNKRWIEVMQLDEKKLQKHL